MIRSAFSILICLLLLPAWAAAQCSTPCVVVDSGAYGPTCWCPSAAAESCSDACVAQGAVCDSGVTDGFAGSAGSAANCGSVLDAINLGTDGMTPLDVSCGASGFSGCIYNSNTGNRGRCTNVPTACDQAPAAGVQRACACRFSEVAPTTSYSGLVALALLLALSGGMFLHTRQQSA